MTAHEAVKPLQPGLTPEEFAAWGGFLRVHAAVIRSLDAELQAAHHLPLTEFEVLLRLSSRSGRRLRMSELAESVLLSLSGVSRLVERLERRGLVRREPCPEDRRGAFAVLTSDGLALVRQARATHWAGIRERFLRHFSGEDLEQLATYWARMLEEDPLLEVVAHPDVGGGAACQVTGELPPVPARSKDATAATGTRRKQGAQRERGETEGER